MECISIIIPVYNSSSFLRRCVDSILAQSYKGSKEVILVDDGSTDGSGAICDDYVRKNADVTVYHTENKGASLARRYGLERASGEYVTFVDSDDYVSPNYLSILYNIEKRFKLGVSACAVQILSESELEKSNAIQEEPIILKGDDLFHRFFQYEFWGFYGKIYRKSLLLDIPFPEETLNEDYYVMAHLLHNVGRIMYVATPLYYYYHHQGSLSRQAFSSKSFEEYVNVKGVYDFISKEMPQYKNYALANVVESVVKLLIASKGHKTDNKIVRQELRAFLTSHKKDIFTCKPLNRKTAFLAMLFMF